MEIRKSAKELPPAWVKLAANKKVVLLMDFNLMEETDHLPDITASALGLLPGRVLHAIHVYSQQSHACNTCVLSVKVRLMHVH